MNRQSLLLAIAFLGLGPFVSAQQPVTPPPVARPADYVLGPFDQITVIVGELKDDFDDKTFRVDGNGDVSLPLAGRIRAGGLTTTALADEIKKRLSPILKNPDVVVNITEFASQSVSVLGAVTTPGVQKLAGQKTLFDLLSGAEGLTETSGTTIKITREARWGVIPLPGATVDPVTGVSTATVRVKEVAQAGPANIVIMPGDAVFVPRADMIFAVGSVTKPGGFPIGEKETLSALQVVSLAQGLEKNAAADKAKILRLEPGSTSRVEIAVNIKKLMAGKTPDIPLKADDILFIPNSGAKSAANRTVDAIVNAASGLAVLGSRL